MYLSWSNTVISIHSHSKYYLSYLSAVLQTSYTLHNQVINHIIFGILVITCGLIVIDINPLQLEVRVSMVCASGIDAMFIRDHLPKL